jgi:surface protein
MSAMFQDASSFNNVGQDLSWNVSKVTNMQFMFQDASSFDSNITNWDVSNVENMNSMFANAKSFNQDLSAWDISKAANQGNISNMFAGAIALASQEYDSSCFNILKGWIYKKYITDNIDDWNIMWNNQSGVGRVNNQNWLINTQDKFDITMQDYFEDNDVICGNAKLLYGDIGTWGPLTNVTTMQEKFVNKTSFNEDISLWDVSNVFILGGMFYGASIFNINIGNWNTSSCLNMLGMFALAFEFDQDLSAWNVSQVTDMSNMFTGANKFNNGGQDLSWNVSNVTTIYQMFYKAIRSSDYAIFNSDRHLV